MFDYIIIGAGPGGLGLAYSLNNGKRKVAIIENDKWGGTCPNYGCDPTKVMMAVVEAKARVENLKNQGITGELSLDWKGIRGRKLAITDPLEEKTLAGLQKSGITALYGTASFTTTGEIQVADKVYKARNYIIATGTRPRQLDIVGKEFLKTSNDFLALEEMPRKVTFIGAGSVSLELAQIAHATGAEVTVIASGDLEIGHFDKEIGEVFLNQLKAEGIVFKENINISKVEKSIDGFVITDKNGHQLLTDLVIAGVGRVANVDLLNLEAVGVGADQSGVFVDEYLQTSHPQIYALGDVISKKQGHFTPVSDFEGRYLGENLVSTDRQPIDYPVIPAVIFGATKLAQVGQLEGEGIKLKSFDLSSWYTYKRINDPVAKMKVAVNDANEIVGAVTVSSVADEVINLLMILIQQKINLLEFDKMISAYPTVASDLGYFY